MSQISWIKLEQIFLIVGVRVDKKVGFDVLQPLSALNIGRQRLLFKATGNFFYPSPQTEPPKNGFSIFPKDMSDVSDIVFLGYFDVSEHVCIIISRLDHLLEPVRDRQKIF